jgi:S1-C subfamily serine protease
MRRDDRPTRRTPRRQEEPRSVLPVVAVVFGVGGLFLVFGGVVVAALFFLKKDDQDDSPAPAVVAAGAPQPAPVQPPAPPQRQPPPVVEEPPAKSPPVSPAGPPEPAKFGEVIPRVKAATVYIRTFRGRLAGTGSGFFAAPGYVVTNAHVLGYGPPDNLPATRVEVVIASGERGERTLPAQVYGVDVEADLAVLAVAGDRLPPPLAFGKAGDLIETQEVVIFGYPFGELLGKNISVNRSTVSSLRREAGRVAVVQLAGGLNPGNSGGPVTNARGQVVGVAVARLKATETIAFAIPGETAAAFVEDQVRSGGRIIAPPVPDPPQPEPNNPGPAIAFRPATPPATNERVYVPKGEPELVTLPGRVADTAVGGAGRYLIFRVVGKRVLAVFDTRAAQVVREIPLTEDTPHFAAGADQLVIVYPGAKLIQVWNLATFKRERSAPLPDPLTTDSIHQVCMGTASAGPLFAYLPKEKRTFAVDLKTLQATEIRWSHWSHTGAYGPLNMRAAPDGTMLAGWGGGWAGCEVATFLEGKQTGLSPKIEFWSGAGAFALPTADSSFVLTPWACLSRSFSAAKIEGVKNAYYVPAAEPGFFLALLGVGEVGAPARPGKSPSGVAVFNDDRRKLFVLPDLQDLTAHELPWEKRVFYYPRSGLLATLTPGNDGLVLRRVDLREQLDRSGADYLAVVSRPPDAVQGKRFVYQLGVRSKKGGVKVRLDAGPDGMSVSADGRVAWEVPPGFARPARVILTVADASGQEVIHTFELIPSASPR